MRAIKLHLGGSLFFPFLFSVSSFPLLPFALILWIANWTSFFSPSSFVLFFLFFLFFLTKLFFLSSFLFSPPPFCCCQFRRFHSGLEKSFPRAMSCEATFCDFWQNFSIKNEKFLMSAAKKLSSLKKICSRDVTHF